MTGMDNMTGWNARLYQESHSFVWEYGRDLVDLLAPAPGDRILDLGCGSGQLTAEIAAHGAAVIGLDRSAAMAREAHERNGALSFVIASAAELPFANAFDAVFSNAVLHWIKNAEEAIAAIARALKPGGRFVAEFGGHRNVQAVVTALTETLAAHGIQDAAARNPWYFPAVGDYAAKLERHGFEVAYATLFDRMTRLSDGDEALAKWLEMFGGPFFTGLSEDLRAAVIADVEAKLLPRLHRNGNWHVDYRRIRVKAVKSAIPAPDV